MFKSTLIAGAGGMIGTIMRFLSEKIGALLCHGAFPLGTFMANMFGCFLIGVFYGWVVKTQTLSKSINLFLITGLCGGFTTFSSFSDEMVQLIEKGDITTFSLYLASSIILGLIMVVAGLACVPTTKATIGVDE